MKINYKKVWAHVGLSGLLVILLFGNLIYMNLRPSDPILPGWEEYDAQRFNALMRRGEPVIVEIYAPWCPTCLLQHRALETLHEQGTKPLAHAVRVDFDKDVIFREKYGINHTGILIIFHRGRQIAHASGLITAEKIDAFISEELKRL